MFKLQDKEWPVFLKEQILRYYNQNYVVSDAEDAIICYKPCMYIDPLNVNDDDIEACRLTFKGFKQSGQTLLDVETGQKINEYVFISSCNIFITQNIVSDKFCWYTGERFFLHFITNEGKVPMGEKYVNENDIVSTNGNMFIGIDLAKINTETNTYHGVPNFYREFFKNNIGLFILTYVQKATCAPNTGHSKIIL